MRGGAKLAGAVSAAIMLMLGAGAGAAWASSTYQWRVAYESHTAQDQQNCDPLP